jgi:hypothetical protein
MTAWFAYIDDALEKPETETSFQEQWREMELRLWTVFGKPSNPRGNFDKRWCVSLSAYVAGVPRGVYFANLDDLLVFKLMYPRIRIREPVSGK